MYVCVYLLRRSRRAISIRSHYKLIVSAYRSINKWFCVNAAQTFAGSLRAERTFFDYYNAIFICTVLWCYSEDTIHSRPLVRRSLLDGWNFLVEHRKSNPRNGCLCGTVIIGFVEIYCQRASTSTIHGDGDDRGQISNFF